MGYRRSQERNKRLKNRNTNPMLDLILKKIDIKSIMILTIGRLSMARSISERKLGIVMRY